MGRIKTLNSRLFKQRYLSHPTDGLIRKYQAKGGEGVKGAIIWSSEILGSSYN